MAIAPMTMRNAARETLLVAKPEIQIEQSAPKQASQSPQTDAMGFVPPQELGAIVVKKSVVTTPEMLAETLRSLVSGKAGRGAEARAAFIAMTAAERSETLSLLCGARAGTRGKLALEDVVGAMFVGDRRFQPNDIVTLASGLRVPFDEDSPGDKRSLCGMRVSDILDARKKVLLKQARDPDTAEHLLQQLQHAAAGPIAKIALRDNAVALKAGAEAMGLLAQDLPPGVAREYFFDLIARIHAQPAKEVQ